MPTRGTIKPGNRDFPVGKPFQRLYEGVVSGPPTELVATRKGTTDVGNGMFLYNIQPGEVMTEENQYKYEHNRDVLSKLAEQTEQGVEK